MVRILLLGGTWQLGRLVAANVVAREWEVTTFNRGRGTLNPAHGVRHVRGDRGVDADLQTLRGHGPWDAVVDISGKAPTVVRRSAEALVDVTDKYLSVSTVSAYRDWPSVQVDEESPLLNGSGDARPAGEPDTYGRRKAACEHACREIFGGDRLLSVRLHDVIGQEEDLGPVLWWLNRIRRGGPVLVPAPDRGIQAVDVQDVARFLVDLSERGVVGAVNVAAAAAADRTFEQLLTDCLEVVTADRTAGPELVWVEEDWLAEQKVQEQTELPLWRRADGGGVTAERAVALGLHCRPLRATVSDTWVRAQAAGFRADHERITRYGMPAEREADLLARWDAQRASAQPAGFQRVTSIP